MSKYKLGTLLNTGLDKLIKQIPAGGEIFSDHDEKEDESREMAPEALCSHLGWGCGVGLISQL